MATEQEIEIMKKHRKNMLELSCNRKNRALEKIKDELRKVEYWLFVNDEHKPIKNYNHWEEQKKLEEVLQFIYN